MKAQISFEFMLYLVVAATALATGLFFASGLYSKESGLYGSSAITQFVSEVNFNMQSLSSSFYAYVPRQLCGADVSGRSFTYDNSTYTFYGNVTFSNALCPGGMTEELLITGIGNDTFTINVVQ